LAFLERLKLAQPFDTWPQMELVAEQRYWDGLTLALSDVGSKTSAIYLLGYVAEILLKTAYFRIIDIPPYENIASELRNATLSPYWREGNLHNLRNWLSLLNEVRSIQGKPWDPDLAATVDRNVLMVASHWQESLRYSYLPSTDLEVQETFASVDWLLMNYDILWR